MNNQYRLLLILIFLLTGTYFLFSGGLGNFVIRSAKELWNLGHIVYFSLTIYFLVETGVLKKLSLPSQWLVFLLLSFLWGTLIEVLQYGTQRTPDMADILRDLTGCLLVLSFHPKLLNFTRLIFTKLIRLGVSVLLIVQLYPLVVSLTDEATAAFQFPVLSNFETAFELTRWDGDAGKEIVRGASNNYQLKISLTTSTYSGVGLKYFPSNWAGYKSVNLRVFNPLTRSLTITVRVHDAQHQTGPVAYSHDDRFNKRIRLFQGWNELSIPLSAVEMAPRQRKMDMTRISDISLFVVRLPEPVVIYLDSIRLQ